MLLLALPAVLAGAYGTWFLHSGYRRDPVLRLAGELARRDGMARMVLGSGIHVVGVEGRGFSWMQGIGGASAYVVILEGSHGQGRLAVTAHRAQGRTKLDSAILAGPGGGHYDLLHHSAGPSGDTI